VGGVDWGAATAENAVLRATMVVKLQKSSAGRNGNDV